jgi:hypothetical protein
VISTKGISMDDDEVDTVRIGSRENNINNGLLNNLVEVQKFPDFCNFYGLFIRKYLENAKRLTRLNKKDEPFVLESEQQLAVEMKITAFTKAPALRHFDHDREALVKTDALDYVSAGVLSK